MAFNPTEFRAALVGDGARQNLFKINMNFPSFTNQGTATQGVSTQAAAKITLMCNAAQLPGVTVGVIPMQYFGREVKVAGNKTFQDWTITIINDEDFLIRNSFERWLQGINSHNANLRSPNARTTFDYAVDASVDQYGKEGDIIKTYNFVGMFPMDISPIDVAWGSNDAIEEFSVTLAYQYWTDNQNGII